MSLSEEPGIPSFEDQFGKWYVFYIVQNKKKICYSITYPIDSNTNHSDYQKSSFMVSLFDKNQIEISIVGGYQYRNHTTLSVNIDTKQFRFIAEKENVAYFAKYNKDQEVIDAMLKSFRMIVFSESVYGTYAIDTYSLEGFRRAYQKLYTLCPEYLT